MDGENIEFLSSLDSFSGRLWENGGCHGDGKKGADEGLKRLEAKRKMSTFSPVRLVIEKELNETVVVCVLMC